MNDLATLALITPEAISEELLSWTVYLSLIHI